MPAMNKLYDLYQTDSVAFIAITFDNTATIRKFLNKKEFHFTIVQLDQSVICAMKKMSYYPITFNINRRQEISYVFFGKVVGKDPEDVLFNLLVTKIRLALSENNFLLITGLILELLKKSSNLAVSKTCLYL
jgi:peroxiredoxin